MSRDKPARLLWAAQAVAKPRKIHGQLVELLATDLQNPKP